MSSPFVASVAAAACKGLLLWAILYLTVIVCLIGYKWDKVNNIEIEHVVVENKVIKYIDPEPKEVIVEKKKKTPPVDEEEMKRTALLLEEIKVAKQRQAKLLLDAEQYINLIEHNSAYEPSAPEEPTLTKPETTYVGALLRAKTLSDSTPKVLEEFFTSAFKELDAMKDDADITDWSVLENIVTQKLERGPPQNVMCIESPITETATTTNTIPNLELARISDLLKAKEAVQAKIAERTDPEALPNLLATSKVMGILEEEVINTIQAATEASESRVDVDYGNCVDEDTVLDMIEEGLIAMKARQNLQTVLTRYVSELRPDDPPLILDAQLAPPSRPYVPPPDYISLRQMLDTQLLQQSTRVLDIVADLIGGYIDMLDDKIDQLEKQSGGSVGKALVALLLESAGNVRLPNPESLVKVNAGVLREPLF